MVGDPLDQKLFAATQWTMEEETEHAYDEGSPRAALHGHPSSSLTALLSSALNRNLEGLNSLPPHEKGTIMIGRDSGRNVRYNTCRGRTLVRFFMCVWRVPFWTGPFPERSSRCRHGT